MKQTAKERRLADARGMFDGTSFKSMPAQAEACDYLKGLKLTREEIAAVLGLTERQVKTRLNEYRLYASQGLIPTVEFQPFRGKSVTLKEDPHESTILDEIEKLNRSSTTKLANVSIKNDLIEQRLVVACAAKMPLGSDLAAVEKLYNIARKDRIKSKGEEEIAVATMSDLHLGLDTPQHPFAKAKLANDNFVRRVLKLTNLHRVNFPVPKLHLNLLGDLIQGSSANYAAQRWDTTIPAVLQIERMTEVAVKDIETFLVDFDEVTVNCSPGNHGNLLKDSPDPGNWESVMHRSLRWAFRDNKRVKFNIEEDDFYQVIDINGSKFLLMHGHSLKGGNFDGLITSFRKYADVLPAYRYAIIGHFHRCADLPLPRQHGHPEERTLFMNGTAAERDDYIEKMGGSPTPLWWLFFVGSKGITSEHKVRLY